MMQNKHLPCGLGRAIAPLLRTSNAQTRYEATTLAIMIDTVDVGYWLIQKVRRPTLSDARLSPRILCTNFPSHCVCPHGDMAIAVR